MCELGIIFHLGLYSVYAYDNPKFAKMRQIKNGSEWYLNRITYTNFRGSKSESDAKQYHKDNFNNQDYYLAENSFTLQNLDFDKWMEFVKSIGFSYVILTAKHHDGYCLWDTKTTEHNCCSKNSVVNIIGTEDKNIVKLFVDAARRHNLEVGLYYSFFEFLKSPTKQNIMIPQMDELIEYNVDRYFFDGNWPMKSLHSNTAIEKICEKILIKNPNCKINDRLGNSKLYRLDKNYLGMSTYRTYNDREIPNENPEVPWEHINTIGLSWGINKQQTNKHFKSGSELFELYKKVKNKGGNFLINMGPDCDGTLQIEEKNALLEFKKIMDK